MLVTKKLWRCTSLWVGFAMTVCFSTVASAASVVGTWAGMVTEQNGKSYDIAVTVDEGMWSGRFVYKHYPCGGNLVLSHAVDGKRIFIMRPTFGAEECEDGTFLELRLISDNQVAFKERISNSSAASGTLYRSNEAIDLNTYRSAGSNGGGSASGSAENLYGYSCSVTKVDEGSYDTAENCGPFGNLDCQRGTTFWKRHRYDCSKGSQSTRFFCEDLTDTSGWIPRTWTECKCEGAYFSVNDPVECLQ